jgi:hypothetical protein
MDKVPWALSRSISNIERGLSFQAMRQLYMAYIISIADYGVLI